MCPRIQVTAISQHRVHLFYATELAVRRKLQARSARPSPARQSSLCQQRHCEGDHLLSRASERAIHSAEARLAVAAETASPRLRRCRTGRAGRSPASLRTELSKSRRGLRPRSVPKRRSTDRPTGHSAPRERQSTGRCPMTPQRALWLALSLQPSPAADGVGCRSGGEGWRARRR